jgi:hypothetical protein
MRKLILILALFSSLDANAATKIFLHDAATALASNIATGYAGYGCNSYSGNHVRKLANTTQGSSTVTTSQTPSSTAPPCQFGNESTAIYLQWWTPPIASGFTLSGNINFSAGCSESQTSMNLGLRFLVYRYSKAAGGIVSTIHTSSDTTECGTTLALRTVAAAAPTSTTISAGDRIVFVVEMRNVGGAWGGNSSRTAGLGYDGTAAGTGDAFASFVDTFSFSTDTNDGRPLLSFDPFGEGWKLALPAVFHGLRSASPVQSTRTVLTQERKFAR